MATSRAFSPGGRISRGQATGAFIPVVFGLVFIEANSSQLQRDWQAVVRPVGALVAVALIIGIARARRAAAGSEQAAAGWVAFSRGYWVIVAVEAAALLAGLIVINAVFGVHELAVPWIALVVGVHFFGLGRIWDSGWLHVLGAVMAVLGVAGFVLHAVGAPDVVVALVSGVSSGAALYLAVARWLLFSAARGVA
jgi:hypothetical protein